MKSRLLLIIWNFNDNSVILAPYQTYGQQCVSASCDSTKGLVCATDSTSKTCQCPSGNWFWYNNIECRM